MMKGEAFMVPNPPLPNRAVAFDPAVCNGCNRCAEICRSDVLMPNPEKGKAPIVLYPDECWYCGTCVLECPRPGAIRLVHPLHTSVSVIWKRKTDGKSYRLVMTDPSAPEEELPSSDD
jgi:NAD-dependent dihydropyrimidine dehydrogenase PreA subunit